MASPLPSLAYCNESQVTIVGAGNVGSALAQRIAERDLANVVLFDIIPDRPQGLALDLTQARSHGRYSHRILGTNDYADTAQSDLLVITAGLARRPGMSREDLMATNGKIVAETVRQALVHSPHASIIVVTNPLDVMTYLAWKVSELPPQRVMGMAGMLDSARFQTFLALELGVPAGDVAALVVGSHDDRMVPLPRYSTVSGIPVTELLPPDRIQAAIDRTRQGGAEIVALLKQGGAFYGPAAAACAMVESIVLGQSRILPAAAYLDGQYGLADLYLGTPCQLGKGGVERVIELALTPAEQAELGRSAVAVKDNLNLALATLMS
ncbi:malate dehydrogenase [Leptolyngbya sp. BL0902]|uniref:malate dehydrogenase n=1 Tax=Leptolyngbya sp. BL0902 TaxID=1115757 RepID=UPI0018E6DDCC|nr:malate dehydrogenase [Leptolyngbya sp. BL0902]QQE65816.1 malate dehydrogenase [Leptolyngbya sp. BL0902]